MLLDIISGAAGSGKSSYLYELIEENLKNNPNTNAVVIVPEQFSYSAEKKLSDTMGGLGLNRTEVLTFSRLVHRYVNSENNLLPSGKQMLLCKAALSVGEENVFFSSSKRKGFIDSLAELFSEFKRYQISPEDLSCADTGSVGADKKLSSVNEIYKSYLAEFNENFTDSDNALDIFSELVQNSDIFRNTFFFIDDYSDFLPQHYEAIRAMISSSRGVFVTLCIGNNDENGIFTPVIKAKSRLTAIALSLGAQLYTKELEGSCRHILSKEIKHLSDNFGTRKKYSGNCGNISIFTARDLYSEIEHIASKIIALVRDEGCRFRDIGIIIGDSQQYMHILSAVFYDYNIPFFTDETTPITMHPIVRTVLSLFDILSENWSFNSVFDYLRSGYIYTKTESGVTPLDPEDIDILENYVLKVGIKGKKAWFEEWVSMGETEFDDVIENYSAEEFDLAHLNALRTQIILPFARFAENKGRTVRAIAGGVYDFLCDINLYDGILSECREFDSAGMRNESEQFKQIWNFILEVLDQLVATLGGDIISRDRFCEYLKNGLSQCKISIIPSGLDRVSVGTVSRNSPARIKYLFIAGALYGQIPQTPSSSAILTPAERALLTEALKGADKELAPDDTGRILLENLKLYKILSTATEKLFISFPASDSEGRALTRASFVGDVMKMFPDISVGDDIISHSSPEELLASSKRGFHYLLNRLSEYYREKPERIWQEVFKIYSENPEYKDKLNLLKTAASYKKIQPALSRAKAELLYGKDRKYSITSLEKFTGCPFAYYAEKGLCARPQEAKRVEKSHIGSLIHAAVCEFCKKVENGADTIPEIHEKWTSLTSEDCSLLCTAVTDEMREKILPKRENERGRLEYLLDRCERTLKKSAETIRLSLSQGGYSSICFEKDFEVKINRKDDTVTLFGTIDRIDVIEHIAEKNAGIRIIDYKTGKKKFSIAAIASKIDMQLVLYSIAAVKLYSGGMLEKTNAELLPKVSAIMYNKLSDNMLSLDLKDAASKTEKKVKNKLDGVVILDEDSNGEPIYDTALDMDSALSDGCSEFLNIAFKQDGTLTAASQVTSRATFDLISEYMEKSAIDSAVQIKNGNIDIYPSKTGKNTACTYCGFREICMFDPDFDKCRKTTADDMKAIELIKKELGK